MKECASAIIFIAMSVINVSAHNENGGCLQFGPHREPIVGRDSWAEVNLDLIGNNFRKIKALLPKTTQVLAVIKANAYGHGAPPMARAFLELGATWLGVAFVDEGVQLRNQGITAPILVLGYTPVHAVAQALKHNLTLTVFHERTLNEIGSVAKGLDRVVDIHVNVDTGLTRLGLFPDEVLPFIRRLKSAKCVRLQGLWSHYATVGHNDVYADMQLKAFKDVVKKVRASGVIIPMVHMSGSSGTVAFGNKSTFDMVRIGSAFYGNPLGFNRGDDMHFEPALQVKSRICRLKKPAKGFGVGYENINVTGNQWIATIPIGYSDGLRYEMDVPKVLVKGIRVPLLGINSDMMMADVTLAMPLEEGVEIVVIGSQLGAQITAVDVITREGQQLDLSAKGNIYKLGTYGLSHRLPRIYTKNGNIVDFENPLPCYA